LATIFVAPFMSCSARLPVYALLIGAFFASSSPALQGGILLALYALGIVFAFLTALLFKFGAKRTESSSFILELPSYKRPKLSQITRVVWTNTWAFVSKAGTIIFCLSVILWAMMYYPRLSGLRLKEIAESVPLRPMYAHPLYFDSEISVFMPADGYAQRFKLYPGHSISITPFKPDITREAVGEHAYVPEADVYRSTPSERRALAETWHDDEVETTVAAAQLRQSYAGRLGHLIEPVIKPLGYDWKMGVGLISAFAAREVFVSTMGIVYSVGGDDEDTTPLAQAMLSDRYPDGSKVWTPLVATSLLVWFVLAMQCMSTVAIVRRETGSWKWPILQLLYMTGLAYGVSLIVYQVGKYWFV
jgi:ferrous iron transport protein B